MVYAIDYVNDDASYYTINYLIAHMLYINDYFNVSYETLDNKHVTCDKKYSNLSSMQYD